MQSLFFLSLSIAVLAIAGAFVYFVTGILREARKIGKASEDISSLAKKAEKELADTAGEVRNSLDNVDRLVIGVGNTVERIEKFSGKTEHLLEATHGIVSVADALKSPSAKFSMVYEGFKQGIRALWGSKKNDEEGTNE